MSERENGVFLTGTVTKIEACQVGYGDSQQTIGQQVTITVKVPYVSLPDKYNSQSENKTKPIDAVLFYAGGVRPPMIGSQFTITAQHVVDDEEDIDEDS